MSKVQRPTICVGILTLNEERHIRQCIESVKFADRVVVVDSGSTDSTCRIAEELGCDVYKYPDWKGFGVQRNRLLTHCVEDYIFFVDADEVVSSSLKEEVVTLTVSGEDVIGETYWQEVAFGKKIFNFFGKKSLPRLFRRKNLTGFEGAVHESPVLKNPGVTRLIFKSPLYHYSRETVHDSLRKLTQYSMLGAVKRYKKNKKGGVMRGLASAFAMFLRLYIFRGVFLSGGAGFLYAFFISLECFFRYAALYYDKEYLTEDVKR